MRDREGINEGRVAANCGQTGVDKKGTVDFVGHVLPEAKFALITGLRR